MKLKIEKIQHEVKTSELGMLSGQSQGKKESIK